MPYLIKKVKDGFKVCKKNDKKKCFSIKPLTKEQAMKQMRAIIMSEMSRHGKLGKGFTDFSNYAMIRNNI